MRSLLVAAMFAALPLAARYGQTLLIRAGRIAAIGPEVSIPADAEVIDARGKTLLPGFAMVHEHLFCPTGQCNYGSFLYSFPRLHLAGGPTTAHGYLGRDGGVGSLEPGKRADIAVVEGDPMKNPSAIEAMPLVFKKGVGYRDDAIFGALRGPIGLY